LGERPTPAVDPTCCTTSAVCSASSSLTSWSDRSIVASCTEVSSSVFVAPRTLSRAVQISRASVKVVLTSPTTPAVVPMISAYRTVSSEHPNCAGSDTIPFSLHWLAFLTMVRCCLNIGCPNVGCPNLANSANPRDFSPASLATMNTCRLTLRYQLLEEVVDMLYLVFEPVVLVLLYQARTAFLEVHCQSLRHIPHSCLRRA